ncbi:D-beta-hydroxybutyrate dehydrogenase, mitochondrial [Chrysoperla carnea]|uniref:D-beta-hydroxybutyrate dehydrogenase, mitochondrial n=1 Tax=Chrysoperla carnea TaxID=189513 RepID=UPI001D0703AB|nr:D-beta-hydroxybutyrate dehydrogenase, mitochondrial [Chrysoperla carnea]
MASTIYKRLIVNSGIFLIGASPLLYYSIAREKSVLNILKATAISTLGSISWYYYTKDTKKLEGSFNRVVFITGCDSGLGYSFAQHTTELGFTVFAGFLDVNSEGSKQLQKICGNLLVPLQLDICNEEHVQAVEERLTKFFDENPNAEFHALINNAGVMVFGEFDWQTKKLINDQIQINLFGTMRITQICLPFLRKHKGRIISIGSHCASVTLPGLAVYGATKAALHAWSDGLRLELAKYGVRVIKFVPGSFITQSKIMDRLKKDRMEIENNLTEEKQLFYNNYIENYYDYLTMIPSSNRIEKINDKKLYEKFEAALKDQNPKTIYKHEPFNYRVHHFLFKILPTKYRDLLVCRFVQLPVWKPVENEREQS